MTTGQPAAPVVPQSLSVVNAYMQPGSLASLREWSAALVQSGLLPAHVKTWQQALVILLSADQLGVHPMTALQAMYVVHGKIGSESKFMLALIQRTGLLEEFTLESSPTKATCRMKRRGGSTVERTITMEEAERAGWTRQMKRDKDGKVVKNAEGQVVWVPKDAWRGMPALMLENRVTARVARILWPDVILGLYMADELDVPVRVEAGEVIVDAETVAAEAPPAGDQTQAAREATKAEEAGPSEEQRGILSMLFGMKGKNGKPYVGAADRKKWSTAIAEKNTASMFAAAIDTLQAIVNEARDAEASQPTTAEGGLFNG